LSVARPSGRPAPQKVMYFVYILQSTKDKRTYVGYTKNISVRLQQHNSGYVKATKHRRPFKVLFFENFHTEIEARKREAWWKSGSGRRKLKENMEKTYNTLVTNAPVQSF